MSITIAGCGCAEGFQNVAVMGSTVLDPVIPNVGCKPEEMFSEIGVGAITYAYEAPMALGTVASAPADYSATNASNALKTVQFNNYFSKASKTYFAVSNSVPYDKQATELTKVANLGARTNGKVELACLVASGTASESTDAVTTANIKGIITADLSAIRATGANPTIAVCTPDFYANLILAAGDSLTDVDKNMVVREAEVGKYLGVIWVSSALLGGTFAYNNASGTSTTVDMTNVDYVMWDGRMFTAVNVVDDFAIKDGGAAFPGTAACMSSRLGVCLDEATACIVKSHA